MNSGMSEISPDWQLIELWKGLCRSRICFFGSAETFDT
jgi:hypothetical protein